MGIYRSFSNFNRHDFRVVLKNKCNGKTACIDYSSSEIKAEFAWYKAEEHAMNVVNVVVLIGT